MHGRWPARISHLLGSSRSPVHQLAADWNELTHSHWWGACRGRVHHLLYMYMYMHVVRPSRLVVTLIQSSNKHTF